MDNIIVINMDNIFEVFISKWINFDIYSTIFIEGYIINMRIATESVAFIIISIILFLCPFQERT